MLTVISPAKTLDYESPLVTDKFTYPNLMGYSKELIDICRTLTPVDIASLMKVSDKIASLNAVRFEEWSTDFSLNNSRQAILAFKGDVYTGLDARSMVDADFDFAQRHLRMLSGLYGVLKPLDLMQPYRLEMGTRLENQKGKNLYQFWENIITDELNTAMVENESDILVNLASNEYVKSVNAKHLNGIIVTPVFKDCKNGQYKVISFYAKKARGMMARYIIDNQIEHIDDLKSFNVAGYSFEPSSSAEHSLVFKREEQ